MANGYVSSVSYAAVTAWAALTTYSLGALRRQLTTPTQGNERVFCCTTGGISGASEPTWSLSGTTTDGTVTWTEVTGNESYQGPVAGKWTAPHATLHAAEANGFSTIFVSSTHSETWASALTLQLSKYAYCTPETAVPPTSTTTGASIATSGNNNLTVNGNGIGIGGAPPGWVEGFTFTCGSGANSPLLVVNPGPYHQAQIWKNCNFIKGNTVGVASSITVTGDNYYQVLDNCSFKFSSTTTPDLDQISNMINVIWKNSVALLSGSSIPTSLLCQTQIQLIDSVDFSNFTGGAATNLFDVNSMFNSFTLVLQNCTIPSGIVYVANGWTEANTIIDFVRTGATQLYYSERDHTCGLLTTDTTAVRSGGASDGTQTISWKIDTNGNACLSQPFPSPPIMIWNDTVGSSVNVTIELATGWNPANNADVWFELTYLAGIGPLGTTVSTAPASHISASTTLTTSSASWSGSPGTPYKATLTVTPGAKGYMALVCKMAKPSQTMHLDPVITLH